MKFEQIGFMQIGHDVLTVAGANRRWRCQFRCRGSRRESAVAQLFSLGGYRYWRFLSDEFAGGDLTSELGQANSFVPIRLSDFSLRRFESLR